MTTCHHHHNNDDVDVDVDDDDDDDDGRSIFLPLYQNRVFVYFGSHFLSFFMFTSSSSFPWRKSAYFFQSSQIL